MNTVFKGLLDNLGYRFGLSSLTPALLLVAGLEVLWRFSLAVTIETAPISWQGFTLELTTSVPFWAAVAGTALGLVVLNRVTVQFWEGYPLLVLRAAWLRLRNRTPTASAGDWETNWLRIGSDIRRDLRRAQKADPRGRKDLFLSRQALAKLYRDNRLGVPGNRTLPTELGQILRRMELGIYARYGIDPLRMWTPMLLVTPAPLIEQYRIGKTWLDLSLNGATVFSLLSLASVAPAALLGADWLFCPPLLILTAYLLYRSSLPSAEVMRLAMDTSFDLYRGDLLRRWELKLPPTVTEERLLWRQVQAFLEWGDPLLFPEERRSPSRTEPRRQVEHKVDVTLRDSETVSAPSERTTRSS